VCLGSFCPTALLMDGEPVHATKSTTKSPTRFARTRSVLPTNGRSGIRLGGHLFEEPRLCVPPKAVVSSSLIVFGYGVCPTYLTSDVIA